MKILVITILLVLLFPISSAYAQPTNSGFETGDLTGWTTQGNIEVLQSSNIIPSVTPPEGSYFVLLSTGPGYDPSLPSYDIDGDVNVEHDITTLSQSFSSPGPRILSFTWSWLTYEETTSQQYDDIFLVKLDGTTILSGSVDKTPTQSLFSNVATDDVAYSVDSTGSTDQSYFGDGRSAFAKFEYPLSSGSHTIEFIVADAGDDGVDSGLLIDSVGYETPVGGFLVPIDKLVILSPILVLIGFLGILSSFFIMKKRNGDS